MKLLNLLVLLVLVAVVWVVLRKVRPALRERRHRAWEQAGLLPHQIDPHNPNPPHAPEDDTPQN